MTASDDIVRARDALVAGSGQTTRKNRVLPAAIVDPQIPQRVGVAQVRLPKSKTGAIWRRGFTTIEIAGTMPPRRFNPYTLGTLDFPYGIGVVGYDVTTWASGHNVIDNFPWYDVVCFWANKILINAGEMAALQIPVATPAAPAMPYAIPGQVGVEWGDATLNQSEKRVFAVGRTHVQAFNVGGTTAILSPAQPRADGKAMTIGQRIDRVLHKAWLGQLYYTGVSWDSAGGSWLFSSAEVAMMLVAPFLQQVTGSAAVDMARADLTGPGSSSNSYLDRPVTTPQTPVCLIGIGEAWTTSTYPDAVTWPGWGVIWPWRGLYWANVPGTHETGSLDRTLLSNSTSDTTTQAGRVITYSQSNVKTWDNEHSTVFYSYADIDLPPVQNDVGSRAEYSLNSSSDRQSLIWEPTESSQRGPFPPRGLHVTHADGSVINNSSRRVYIEQQTLLCSVSHSSISLVDVNATITRRYGYERDITPNVSGWDHWLQNPYDIPGGWGWGVNARMSQMPSPDLYRYKNPGLDPSTQPPSAHAEINAEFAARQADYAGNECYARPDSTIYPFLCTLSYQETYSAALTWTTRDYLLHDATNGVYLWIEGEFNGAQTGAVGNATLTVRWKCQTRHHSNTAQIIQRTYSYAQLLPEMQVPYYSQLNVVPTPQIRAIFAPMYQEQGSCKGAAYITLAEEQAGSTAAHLFNFQMRLHTWSDVAQISALNLTTDAVHMIPANLLELLYAFVFSQDYGVGRTTNQRYPVTDTTRYNDLTNTLFSDTYPVLVRDGVSGSWAASLNGDSAGLYRT